MTLTNPNIGIAYLDGHRLRRAMNAGARRVIENQEHLNKINVYPVPDGDTGTNLALTMSYIHDALKVPTTRHAGDVLTVIADAALDGARGNSGAIMAQFFQGVSDSVTGAARVTARHFAEAVKSGAAYAREALVKPVEGTILTVMGDFADRLLHLTSEERLDDFVGLMQQGLATAKASLANTPNQLEALRRAGVVDAGAEGFVRMLAGIYDYMRDGQIDGVNDKPIPSVHDADEAAAGHAIELTYRYCTECVVTSTNIDRRRLKEALMDMGDSLVLAGTHSKTRIHIHVNEPGQVFDAAAAFGEVSATKADDMQRQQEESHRANRRVAIMMDSAGDIPDADMARMNIHMTPVRLHFGRESYLDKVTITADEFYRKLVESPVHPTTSQPPPGDFRREFQFLCSHYESVVSINVTGAASGTYQSAASAAQRSGAAERIHVVDSKNVSVGQGLMALYAAECAHAGYSATKIARALAALRPKTPIFAIIRDLTAAVRGGRVTAGKKRVADFLHLTPVIGVRLSGEVGAVGVLPGRRNALHRYIRFLLKRVEPAKTYRLAVAHADCEADARRVLAALEAGIANLDASFFSRVGSALGAHTGPSGLVVCLQEYAPP